MKTEQATKAMDIDLPPKAGGTVTVIERNADEVAVAIRDQSAAQSEASAIIAMIATKLSSNMAP